MTVEASDGTNADTASTTRAINNVAPPITDLSSSNLTPRIASADGFVTISGSFFDPALDLDTHTVTVNWGDGKPVENVSVDQIADTFFGAHVYADGGIYTITVTARDSDHAISGAVTTQAVVQGVGAFDGTLYIIGTHGRDHVDLKFNEKKDELKVDVKLNQGGSEGGSDGGSDKGKGKK